MQIGFLTASVSRNAGGLYDAMRLLARQLSQEGNLSVSVFGLIDEWTKGDLEGWRGLDVHAVPIRGPISLGYAPQMSIALERVVPDVLHTHGLWMYPSFAGFKWGRRHRRPYMISPHGMLDQWALNNSNWKKRIVGMLYENAHLRGARCLHALCGAEFKAIRAYGLINPVCVIPNGVNLPKIQTATVPAWRKSLPQDARILLYLGRLHPKKGLVNLLRGWSAAQDARNSIVPWVLVIAGWDQGGHEAELKALAAHLSINDVLFVGPQFDQNKLGSYACADAFVLPSHSEGLPMTVLEAWSHCLPVIMTPACNLPEGFETGTAIQIQPQEASIVQGLNQLFRMSDSLRVDMGKGGYDLVAERFSWPSIARQMASVYRWILGNGPKPDCVQLG